jgi:hypothetical protein
MVSDPSGGNITVQGTTDSYNKQNTIQKCMCKYDESMYQERFFVVKSASNVLRAFAPTSRKHPVLMLQKKNWTFWTAMHLPLHPQWTIGSLTMLKLSHAFLVMPGVQILLTNRTVNYRMPIDARSVGP